jgi:hypothetical protein
LKFKTYLYHLMSGILALFVAISASELILKHIVPRVVKTIAATNVLEPKKIEETPKSKTEVSQKPILQNQTLSQCETAYYGIVQNATEHLCIKSPMLTTIAGPPNTIFYEDSQGKLSIDSKYVINNTDLCSCLIQQPEFVENVSLVKRVSEVILNSQLYPVKWVCGGECKMEQN